jgi:hypothetical protein
MLIQEVLPMHPRANLCRFATLRDGLRRKEKSYAKLFGTTAQPLLAALATGKTLKSCPDTCSHHGCCHAWDETRVKSLFLLLPKKCDEERHPRKINPALAGWLIVARYISEARLRAEE